MTMVSYDRKVTASVATWVRIYCEVRNSGTARGNWRRIYTKLRFGYYSERN